MPDKEELLKLVAAVRADDSDRSEWKSNQDKWKDLRLCKNAPRKLPYPGAPNLREPIIDDTVTTLTGSELSIMWSARSLAVFNPKDVRGMKAKRRVEVAFDTMLRQSLTFLSKLENLFNLKNERSSAVAKMIETETADGSYLCDILPLEPAKVIVPSCTTTIRTAERVCHEVTMPRREFVNLAKRKGWKNYQEVLDALGKKNTEGTGEKVPQGTTEIGNSVVDIVLWEIYHYGENGVSKWKTVIARDVPEILIDSIEWKWADKQTLTGGTDQLTGLPETMTVKGEYRPWPFVQFRFENRTLNFFDVRGVAEKLEHDQSIAQANLNAKGIMMDYYCKPFVKGCTNLKGFKFRPGELLPDGAEFVQTPRIDSIFDYNVNTAQANAARRVGSPYGALSSTDKSREAKTAAEVKTTAAQNGTFSSLSVERFAEPLAELFGMMWEWCRHERPKLTGQIGMQFFELPDAVYDIPFTVQAGVSGRSANSDMILSQLNMLTQMFGMNPGMQQVIRNSELAKMIVDQIDPNFTDLIVVDPEQAGPAGQAPIEQQLAQIMQLLKGGKNQEGADEQGLVEQVQEQGKYLAAIAQNDIADTGQENGTGGAPQ